jgi:RNA polymerase sigma-70 factor (ECF subfamily)
MEAETRAAGTPASRNEAELTLLRAFQAGDREAFHSLLRPHLVSLVALARRLAGDGHWAEDLAQEALVRAYRGLAGFRGEATLRTWLLRILVRLAAEPSRWRRSEPAGPMPDAGIPDVVGELPEQALHARELQDRLREALERLPARQRAALHLRSVEGMDYAAVADVLGCSTAAARMLVLAARQKVLARLGRYLEP